LIGAFKIQRGCIHNEGSLVHRARSAIRLPPSRAIDPDTDNDVCVADTAAATPSDLGPSDLASAYKLKSARTLSATIAIVDAFNDPDAVSDLPVSRIGTADRRA
jgi:hypothetical protein